MRPSSFGWITWRSVIPDMTAAPPNRSAIRMRSVTDEGGAGVAAHHVHRGAAEAVHVLQRVLEHRREVEQARAAVHEDEARPGAPHEVARPGPVRRPLEETLGVRDALLPVGGPRERAHVHLAAGL